MEREANASTSAALREKEQAMLFWASDESDAVLGGAMRAMLPGRGEDCRGTEMMVPRRELNDLS